MTYLGKPPPPPYVDEDDLYNVGDTLGMGVFPAARIYGAYRLVLVEEGREPVTKKHFGLALREAAWVQKTVYLDGKATRCWTITRRWATALLGK